MTRGEAPTGRSKGYETRRMRAIAARWDAKAADWDRCLADPCCHLNEDNAYQRFLDEAKNVVEQRRTFCRQQGLVDCGCATGLVLQELVPSFAWGIGVDISPKMIRIAQAKRIPNSTFIVGDCFQLSAHTRPVGAVVSRGVLLSHYGHSHGLALLRNARRTLVDGGFFLCDFLNLAARQLHRHVAEDKTYFESGEVRALALAAGFGRAQILGQPERRVLLLLAA